MSKKDSDKIFARLLQEDYIGEPDHAIEQRLMYSFLLKSGGSKSRQNSFAGFFGWLFSAQSIGLKTGLTAIILTFSVVNSHISFDSAKTGSNDSLFTKRVLMADSIRLIQSIDSIQFNPLTSSIFNSGLKPYLYYFPWFTTHRYSN